MEQAKTTAPVNSLKAGFSISDLPISFLSPGSVLWNAIPDPSVIHSYFIYTGLILNQLVILPIILRKILFYCAKKQENRPKSRGMPLLFVRVLPQSVRLMAQLDWFCQPPPHPDSPSGRGHN